MALTDKLTNIADAIRSKTGKTALLTLDAMPTEITSIQTGGGSLPEEAFTITGSCNHRFYNGGWDWFIENYGNQVVTEEVDSCDNMFANSTVTEIPFTINCRTSTGIVLDNMFYACKLLETVPTIVGCKPDSTKLLFADCCRLRTLPEDIESWFDWSTIDSSTNAYSANRSQMLYDCYSLRSIPMGFLNHGNPVGRYSYSIYNYGFSNCYALDEIVDLPNPHLNATWTSNAFSYAFDGCMRAKNITFATPDGQPYVVNWKNQTIDLSVAVGFASHESHILNYNSGITEDKAMADDASYQALKDDPDSFSLGAYYSRYNHDSAVATINSLPDASAYLATAGGTNTIKFRGNSGLNTDGGAISNLTEEEIAVATAKGWTVSIS